VERVTGNDNSRGKEKWKAIDGEREEGEGRKGFGIGVKSNV
jgi:hypothetical protein